MWKKNSLLFGIIIGLVFPFFGYIVVAGIFELLAQTGIIDDISSSVSPKRQRTIFLLAICTNILLIRYYNKPMYPSSLKGVLLSTMGYSVAWFITFYSTLYPE